MNDEPEVGEAGLKRKKSLSDKSGSSSSSGGGGGGGVGLALPLMTSTSFRDQLAPSSDEPGPMLSSARRAQSASSSTSSPSSRRNSRVSGVTFDFDLTEGQSRRVLMADCELECSQILDNLFVAGASVACDLETLQQNGITRVVNCCADVVEDHFLHLPDFKYLSLNMVDGRMEDISWFLGDVIHFVANAHKQGRKVLVHCERGVSRSCSFVIAYNMWISGMPWNESFNFVKAKRACCAPNTAFTCNLIEATAYFTKEWRRHTAALWRCASHLTAHDPHTPVLKLCRVAQSRKLSAPRTSILDPAGVYVLKPPDAEDGTTTPLYVWRGRDATTTVMDVAADLAMNLRGVFTDATDVTIVEMGHEPPGFWAHVVADGEFTEDRAAATGECYDDHFYNSPYLERDVMIHLRYDNTGLKGALMAAGMGGVSQQDLQAGFVDGDDDDDDDDGDMIYAVSGGKSAGEDEDGEGPESHDGRMDVETEPGVSKVSSSGSKDGLLSGSSASTLPSLIKSQTSQDKMKMMSLSLDTSLAQSYSRSATDVGGKSEYGPNSQTTLKPHAGNRTGSPDIGAAGGDRRPSSHETHSARQMVPSLLLSRSHGSSSSSSRPSSGPGSGSASLAALEPASSEVLSVTSQGERTKAELSLGTGRKDDASARSARKASARESHDSSISHVHSQSQSQSMNSSRSGSDASLATPPGSLPPLKGIGVPSPASTFNSARRRSAGDATSPRNEVAHEPSGRVSPRARQDGRAAAAGNEVAPILRKTGSALGTSMEERAKSPSIVAHPPSAERRPSSTLPPGRRMSYKAADDSPDTSFADGADNTRPTPAAAAGDTAGGGGTRRSTVAKAFADDADADSAGAPARASTGIVSRMMQGAGRLVDSLHAAARGNSSGSGGSASAPDPPSPAISEQSASGGHPLRTLTGSGRTTRDGGSGGTPGTLTPNYSLHLPPPSLGLRSPGAASAEHGIDDAVDRPTDLAPAAAVKAAVAALGVVSDSLDAVGGASEGSPSASSVDASGRPIQPLSSSSGDAAPMLSARSPGSGRSNDPQLSARSRGSLKSVDSGRDTARSSQKTTPLKLDPAADHRRRSLMTKDVRDPSFAREPDTPLSRPTTPGLPAAAAAGVPDTLAYHLAASLASSGRLDALATPRSQRSHEAAAGGGQTTRGVTRSSSIQLMRQMTSSPTPIDQATGPHAGGGGGGDGSAAVDVPSALVSMGDIMDGLAAIRSGANSAAGSVNDSENNSSSSGKDGSGCGSGAVAAVAGANAAGGGGGAMSARSGMLSSRSGSVNVPLGNASPNLSATATMNNTPRNSPRTAPAAVAQRPRLFQAVRAPHGDSQQGSPRKRVAVDGPGGGSSGGPSPSSSASSRGDGGGGSACEGSPWVWESLGVYDDEDLVDDGLLLLVCPAPPHYLWVGPDFPSPPTVADMSPPTMLATYATRTVQMGELTGVDLAGRPAAGMTSPAALMACATRAVQRGELTDVDLAYRRGTLLVEFGGEESEAFWNAFFQ